MSNTKDTNKVNPNGYGWVCRICDTYYPEMDQASNCHADEKERRRQERIAEQDALKLAREGT